MPSQPPHDDAGVLPARYRDPVRIATGGMGEVYRARDERLGRTVAVKVQSATLAGDPAFRRRFAREAVAAARIDHPNVATIYDVGEHGGAPYLVMEFVPGGTLATRTAGGPPGRDEALAWIDETAAALDAAHAAGVVHRDVKPANLLLDAQGRVKVADFGIARVLEDTGGTLTAAGTVVGSSGYASPEQAQARPVSAASDVYALAAVAFELLTGARPYAGRTGIAELSAHVHDPVPRATERAPGLPPAVDAVLARGLAKEPGDRHPSAGAFAADLRTAATATAASRPPSTVPATPGRGWVLAGAAVVAALAAVAVAVGMMAGGGGGGGDDPAAVAPTRTVERTTTAPAPEAPPPTPEEAVALTDRSTAALAEGDAAGGLALAERALLALAGTGEPYEGNARYNRGRALIDLGRCAEAVPQLARSVAVGGSDWQMGVRRAALDEARGC